MTSKEITTYIIDLHPQMSKTSYGRSITDLDFGLRDFYENLITKILRGRKTDYVSVIAVHSDKTVNPFDQDQSFQNIEIIAQQIVPTYEDLKRFAKVLKPKSESKDSEADCFEAMLVGVGLLKDTKKYKFIRNIHVITNAEEKIESFNSELGAESIRAINELGVNVVIHGIDFDTEDSIVKEKTPRKSLNEEAWRQIITKYDNGKVASISGSNDAVVPNHSLRKIKPMRQYATTLRFGSGFTSFESKERQEGTLDAFNISIESYPSVKKESLPTANQFVLENEKRLDKIRRQTQYYISKDNDNKNEEDDDEVEKSYHGEEEETAQNERTYIHPFEWENGFKYSNYDLLAVDENLEKLAKLRCPSGMDILGFIKSSDIPIAYFTGEPSYILPLSQGTVGDVLGFNCLCQVLMDLDGIALVRKVEKDNDDIDIVALLPYKLNSSKSFSYSFVLFRLPYKEDVKRGNFPFLTSIKSTSGKLYGAQEEESGPANEESETNKSDSLTSLLPTEDTNKLMEDFILSKTLDESSIKKESITNNFDEYDIRTSRLFFTEPIPQDTKLSESIQENGPILSVSPAIKKFTFHVMNFIKLSLSLEKDLINFSMDENFASKYTSNLVDEYGESWTNLFNLSNVIDHNEDGWLVKINNKSTDSSQRLVKKLNTRYVKKESLEKNKRTKLDNNALNNSFRLKNTEGNYGSGDTIKKMPPNLDDILR